MANPQDTDTGTPHPLSADYAVLSEMTYRRAADANSSHIDGVEGVSSFNLLESPQLQAAAYNWREGADVQTYMREQYGLTVDPEDRGDGLMHVYTDNGFSGYITQRGAETADPSDDQFIITYRGTDIADNAAGEMGAGIAAAGRPLVAPALRGEVSIDWARDAHPSPEEYRAAIAEATGEAFADFTVTRDADGRVTERLVDAGDIYTNGLLGQGTYQETQYDDARALFDMVNQDLATDGQQVITAGQSLGGGLAALVAVENGLESHTFGMAPFQRQFEIIGQREAVADLLTNPETSEQFGDLANQYATGTVPERHAIERRLSDDLSDLRTREGGHDGRNDTSAINRFNTENGTSIDRDTIREFNQQAGENSAQYEANKSELYASTVAGEFTTNSGEGSFLGAAVERGSEQIIPTDQLHTYDTGANQVDTRIGDTRRVEADGGRMFPLTGQRETLVTRGMGEGLSTHSPALNDLVTASQDSDVGRFDDLMSDNPNLRYSLLHRDGLAGGVTSGKVGPDDDMSASQSIDATNETVYRPLANSLRGDGALYEQTHSYFDTLSTQGRGAEGADIDDVSLPSLNGAMTQFGLQELRIRTEGLPAGQTLDGDVARIGDTSAGDSLVSFDMADITPSHDMNRLTGPGGTPIDGKGGIFGYRDLQNVFYDDIRDQVSPPSDQPWYQRDAVATAGVADEITGASQAFRNFNFTEGRLEIPEGALDYRRAMVETGPVTGTNLTLESLDADNVLNGQGTAVFLGAGDNVVTGSNQPDMVSLGAGDDGFVSSVEGGGIVAGGVGRDGYSVQAGTGPVFATVDENYTRVSQVADPATADTAVGMERFTLSEHNDLIVMNGVADGTLIDGAGGRNFVDYRNLDTDFELDLTDGVLATGEAYTSSISDGERTQYFINIDDADIARRAAPAEAGERDDAALTTPEPLAHSLAQMRDDYTDVQNQISESAAAGTLTLEQAQMGKLLSQSGTSQVYGDLDAAGVTTLNIPPHDVNDPSARLRARLEAGQSALEDNDLPTPDSTYLPAQDMTGVSNAAYARAAEMGGAEGEAHLRSESHTADASRHAEQQAAQTVEEDYGAYA